MQILGDSRAYLTVSNFKLKRRGIMKGKILWADVETTGLSAWKNDIIQAAFILEIDGEVVKEFDFKIKPFGEPGTVELEALKVNGKTLVEIYEEPYQDPAEAWALIANNFIEGRIGRYDRADKLVMAGYNVGFDKEFIRQGMEKSKLFDKYFFGGSFFGPNLDVMTLVAQKIILEGETLGGNHKLSDVAKYMGIPLKAHDALEDIRATRAMYYKLIEL